MNTDSLKLIEPLQQINRTQVLYRGRKLAYFAGCDYYRLASHPEVLRAISDTISKAGVNVAASRVTTGNHRLYGQLESALQEFFQTESALLASNGYLPNLLVAQSLAGDYTHALIDEKAHASLRDAAGMLGCPIRTFAHRNAADLRKCLSRLGRKFLPLVMTDGVFSHDGSIAPLPEYLEALDGRGTILVDDAHGAGVLGARGRGTVEQWDLRPGDFIQTITLSKAFGVYGGAVLGSNKLTRKIMARSRIFSGNTPLPLPLAAGALKSIELLRVDESLRKRIAAKVQWIRRALSEHLQVDDSSPVPIIALVPQDARHASRLRRRLLERSIYPSFIRYPGGPESGYFRFAISSEHNAKQLAALKNALVG